MLFGKHRPQSINLALQGGGAHGAFTWGVLDALLEDGRMAFEGVSGTSAGAMNAVILAQGLMSGGRDGARQGLADFWNELGSHLPPGMVQGEGDDVSLSAMSKLLLHWAAYFSPGQLNPLALSPLRDMLIKHINFEQLRRSSPFKLFVGATQAHTGKLRVFREHQMTPEVLMASTCLPRLHHAVSIDAQPYWDGGYSANPPVFPLLYDCSASDILLVLLSPLERGDCGNSVQAIRERITEITFSANLMREMQLFTQALAHARPGFLGTGSLDRRLQNARFHMVDCAGLTSLQGSATKMLAHAPFMQSLMRQGQERARQWLATDFDCVGRRTSVDLEKWFS